MGEGPKSGAFTLTCTSTNTCTIVQSPFKYLVVKIVKYLESLAKAYSTIAGNVASSC